MLGLTTSTTIHKTLVLVHIFWGQARLRVEESGSITLIYQTSEAFQPIHVQLRHKHGTSHTWLFDAFILIADKLHMFYHITLGLVILKWGEPSLLVKAVRN